MISSLQSRYDREDGVFFIWRWWLCMWFWFQFFPVLHRFIVIGLSVHKHWAFRQYVLQMVINHISNNDHYCLDLQRLYIILSCLFFFSCLPISNRHLFCFICLCIPFFTFFYQLVSVIYGQWNVPPCLESLSCCFLKFHMRSRICPSADSFHAPFVALISALLYSSVIIDQIAIDTRPL